jgi:DNA-binding MurR/RpiR family transcriptional regulator
VWVSAGREQKGDAISMPERLVVPAFVPRHERTELPALSKKQRAIVSFIEHNPQFAAFATSSELAKRADVHPATVVRLAQQLGYAGYPELQAAIRHRYLASLDVVGVMQVQSHGRGGSSSLASIDQDLRNLTATRRAWDADLLHEIALLILQARSTLFIGNGSHGGLGVIFAHLCQFMGLPVEAEIRGGVSLGPRLARLGRDDVVIGTTAWWVVGEVRDAFAAARENGATTIAIVDSQTSPLVEVADHVLVAPTESASFFQSMCGPLAMLNALLTEIAVLGEATVREPMAAANKMYARLDVAWDGARRGSRLGSDQDGRPPAEPVQSSDNGLPTGGTPPRSPAR